MASPAQRSLEPPTPRAMTRCECADLPFQEIADRLRAGATLEELQHRTGCGKTCTACMDDLCAFLASRR